MLWKRAGMKQLALVRKRGCDLQALTQLRLEGIALWTMEHVIRAIDSEVPTG
jgi:hypothetical protein